MLEQRTLTLTNNQIKIICEYFAQQLQADGIDATYSYLCFKNYTTLAPLYNNIISSLYDEKLDAEFIKFKNDDSILRTQYAERDANGNVKFDSAGVPIITTNIETYKQKFNELIEKYKTALEERQRKIQNSYKLLNDTTSVDVLTLKVSEFPNSIIPLVVGTFGIE